MTDAPEQPVGHTAERFVVIPCEAEGTEHLSLIWDRETEQVIDVLDAKEAAAYGVDQL